MRISTGGGRQQTVLLHTCCSLVLSIFSTKTKTTTEMVQEISERLILHWNYRGYSSLPEELCVCGNHVCELYLKYNNITQLPDWIDTMTNLTNIYLQANYLTELPEAIQFLTNLETLDVSQNQLSKIPPAIGKLRKLRRIVLTQNQITSLPSSVGNLPSLTSLLLSSNRLTELPYSLHQCTQLEDLHLDFNNLTRLPNFLTRMPHLHVLSVCSNQLINLPHLPFVNIQRFHCDNNPRISNLPYPLACQLNRSPAQPLATRNVLHFSCHGCFRPSSQEVANIRVEDSPLCFSPSISLFYKNPPSLLELTLRLISSRIFGQPIGVSFEKRKNLHRFQSTYHQSYDRRISEFCLPSTLIQVLQDGPNAFCLHCQMFIFHGPSYPVFLSKILVQHERQQLIQQVVCSLLFCSTSCFQKAISLSESSLSDRLDWEHITPRTSSN